jgi:hypothetical protein
MLIAVTGEFEDVWIIAVLKTKKHILPISKKPMLLGPGFGTKSAKNPSKLILHN